MLDVLQAAISIRSRSCGIYFDLRLLGWPCVGSATLKRKPKSFDIDSVLVRQRGFNRFDVRVVVRCVGATETETELVGCLLGGCAPDGASST